MENVFSYFVAIGAGLTTGVALVALPMYWIVQKLKQRREKQNAKRPSY